MNRRASDYLTIDELLNRALTRLHSRRGRRVLILLGVVAVGIIVLVPIALRSQSAKATNDTRKANSIVIVAPTTTSSVPLAVVLPPPNTGAVDSNLRIGPPLHRPTTTTKPPATTPTTSAPIGFVRPVASVPAPPPTAAPASVPDSTPDTGVVVPH
jgi:hypothetical protein